MAEYNTYKKPQKIEFSVKLIKLLNKGIACVNDVKTPMEIKDYPEHEIALDLLKLLDKNQDKFNLNDAAIIIQASALMLLKDKLVYDVKTDKTELTLVF